MTWLNRAAYLGAALGPYAAPAIGAGYRCHLLTLFNFSEPVIVRQVGCQKWRD
jgi:hypothetical protein